MCERAFLQRGSNNSMLPDAACSCQKPAVVRNCTCGVTMCTTAGFWQEHAASGSMELLLPFCRKARS